MPETTTLEVVIQGKDQFTATANKVSGSLKNLEKTAGAVGGHLASGIGSAVANLTKLGILAGGFLATQVKFGISALEDLERVTKATTQVLKSTHDASGQTTKGIVDLANAMEDLNATIDNKVIQSAENLLLTFTSIGPKAFKPALQAILDMNQAMGGGEGGLQGTAIQVGKALQDPIRGITALRRVGVNFSEDQIKTIKNLIKHNNLLGAQKLILAELGKEFGGQFKTAGQTAEGTFAKLGDTIEDLQMKLAEALLPTLVDLAKELTKIASDPGFQKGVADLGKGLADGFKAALSWARQVPWKAIGDGLRTAAGFAGNLIKAFAEAPDWLKTAVITGWGLNKLTGGAVTNIFGDIAKGIGGQFLSRGASPVNPLFVKDVGGIGLPGVAGGAGLTAGGVSLATIGTAAAVGAVAIIGTAAVIKALDPSAFTEAPGVGGARGSRTALPGAGTGGPGGGSDITLLGPPVPAFLGGGSHSEDRKIQIAVEEAAAAATQTNTEALRANSIRLGEVDATWAESLGKGVHSRSVAKYGGSGLGKAAESATYQRDILRRADGIVKGSQDQNTKLARLQGLLKDAKNATDATKRKLSSDIKTLSAAIKKQPILITVNANTNVNLNGRKIAQANASTNAYGKYQTGQVL